LEVLGLGFGAIIAYHTHIGGKELQPSGRAQPLRLLRYGHRNKRGAFLLLSSSGGNC
jgi:hypothetical protein